MKSKRWPHYPHTSGSRSGKEDMKKEVVRLGVKLSLCVAESMFLLCDDIRTMLFFCLRLWRDVIPQWNPVSERLLLVIHHYVYSSSKDIKTNNNGVYIQTKKGADGKSAQWNLIRTAWTEFVCGIITLHRLVLVLRTEDCSFDDRLLSSAIEKYKHVLKSLEDKMRSAKDVSEANGFVRDSRIFHFWKSIFDDDHEEAEEETHRVIKNRIFIELFGPILGETTLDMEEIMALPLHSPYILGSDFAKEELKKEVVRLGLELSLHVVESMFLLCDDIRTMLWFCYSLWRGARSVFFPNSIVLERLVRVIHYVYLKYIKPKKGVYHNNRMSAQLRLVRPTLRNYKDVFVSLDMLVHYLRGEASFACGRKFTVRMEEQLKQAEEKLRCGKAVSEANGFRREAIECSIFGLWTSVFDKEAKEATQTLKVINNRILRSLFGAAPLN